MRTQGLAVLVAGATFTWIGAANAASVEDRCAALLDTSTPGLHIVTAKYTPAGPSGDDPQRAMTGASGAGAMLPAHCMVQGEIGRRTGSDGKTYVLRFELRLPDDWMGRFLFQGGGGTDGFLANAVGSIPFQGSTGNPALARGYAVVSMNGGHDGLDASFGQDQQARVDFAYAAIGKVTEAAKELVTRYYSAPISHSYFMGCSNGGREAMIAAQRYPTEFDGVVAGNAGFHLSRAAIGEAWDTQAFMRIAPPASDGRKVLANALTDADLELVSGAVLKGCDAADGIRDGLINNYRACRFDIKSLQCHGDETAQCLSSDKVTAIDQVFSGARDSRGNQLYSGWPYDAGVASIGWRQWKLGSSQDPGHPDAISAMLGAASLSGYFLTPPSSTVNMFTFDFDRDPARTLQTGAINDAVSTFMTTFEQRGGKLLLVHGLSDPVFSASDIMRWIDEVTRDTDGGDAAKREAWSRLFMVPGMTHCGGGPALDDFDPLTAIQQWVESNSAPEAMIAKGKTFPGKQQPLCSYPKVAMYHAGDPNHAASYACESVK